MKYRSSGAQGAGCFSLAVPLTSFAFPRTKKISSESHLYEEFVRRPEGAEVGIERDESHGRGAFSLVTPSHLCYNT